MADSNITKKALAESLKTLMKETEFSKISVADICNRCDMNRKSFYYHFKDKYDLVNWIFDMEFFDTFISEVQNDSWELLKKLCDYFYENKKFYRNALKIHGQNSFEEHLIEMLVPVIEEYIGKTLGDDCELEFCVNFYIDAYIGAIKRWIMDKKDVKPDKFLESLKNCLHVIAMRDLLLQEENEVTLE